MLAPKALYIEKFKFGDKDSKNNTKATFFCYLCDLDYGLPYVALRAYGPMVAFGSSLGFRV